MRHVCEKSVNYSGCLATHPDGSTGIFKLRQLYERQPFKSYSQHHSHFLSHRQPLALCVTRLHSFYTTMVASFNRRSEARPRQRSNFRSASEGAHCSPLQSCALAAPMGTPPTPHRQHAKWQQQASANLTTCDHSVTPFRLCELP